MLQALVGLNQQLLHSFPVPFYTPPLLPYHPLEVIQTKITPTLKKETPQFPMIREHISYELLEYLLKLIYCHHMSQ